MRADHPKYPGVPEDFPVLPARFSLAGVQLKINLVDEGGHYYTPGTSPSEMLQVFERCEKLAQFFVDYCRQKEKSALVTPTQILRRLHTNLSSQDWCSHEQYQWVVRRVGELLNWPVPDSLDELQPSTDLQVSQELEVPSQVDSVGRNLFRHEYGTRTLEEIAKALDCSTDDVHAREEAGEIFAVHKHGTFDAGYPMFQLNDRLNKAILKIVILKFREADVNNIMLWSFLRTPQKVFSGWTPMEMLLGARPSAFDVLSNKEWNFYFLDEVDEAISRFRW